MRVLITKAQSDALKGLREHNGDGLFDKNGVLVAGGERAPFTRGTWNALRDLGHVEFYRPQPRGASRLRIREQVAA
jgi:hypothetical protein